MKEITREEAKREGLTRYFINRLCVNGHTCERSVKNNRCIECRKASLKEWRKVKPRHRVWNKEWARNRRLKVLIKVGGKNLQCKCCGETSVEFLTIDHKNGDGAAHRKSFGKSKGTPGKLYTWILAATVKEVRGILQILCWCCNCSIGMWGYCPHKQPSQFK